MQTRLDKNSLDNSLLVKSACSEIIEKLSTGEINKLNLEDEKIIIAKKYGINKVPKNAEIFQFVEKDNPKHDILSKMLKIKPVRTLSGVANIAVMWLDFAHKSPHDPKQFYSCPAACVYCAQGSVKGNEVVLAPKSYTGCEPTTMRAIRNGYDPWKQVTNRLKQLHIIGHATDKCELIIMGGTFTAVPDDFQDDFIKRCFDAFNENDSESLSEAQLKNESAKNRCIGLTIETRADFCRPHHVEKMLEQGCTRVEIGVQSTSDELLEAIKRGHDAQENVRAIRLLKDAGLKVTAHWMPGLTGLLGDVSEEEELRLFKNLFENPDYRPDELKIYPALVLPGTQLHEMWQRGEYKPLTGEQMLRLLIKIKQAVPSYVRIKRVMRDISEHEAAAGASTTNLRQLAKIEMEKSGLACKCIRCREVGFNKTRGIPELKIMKYDASGGVEYFVSMESENALHGFVRLRISGSNAFVRELHVYGEMTPLGEIVAVQHKGLGKNLLAKSEQLAKENCCEKLLVTSGVGVREYYRRLGYRLEGCYMGKTL